MNQNGLRSFGFHSQEDSEIAATLNPATALAADKTETSATAALDAETVARNYLDSALASDELPAFTTSEVGGQSCEFKIISTETVKLTKTQTVKFRQFYRKIPVYGSLVTIELGEDNELVALNSALGEPHNVDPVAKISPADALQVIRRVAGYESEPLDEVPRLYYYFDPQVELWRLVYIAEHILNRKAVTNAESAALPLVAIADYIVDAHNGELVAEVPRVRSVQPLVDNAADGLGAARDFSFSIDPITARRQMSDAARNVHTHDFQFNDVGFMNNSLPGRFVTLPPAPWSPAGVSAHANATDIANFIAEVLQRNGIDNRGGRLISSINCVWQRLGSNGREWRNAAWIGTQMVYGQRLSASGELRSYALALDIVAHEIFHGVIQHSADLQYRAMSGALNESYADIFGIIVSNFREPNIDLWNWEMGEDLDGTGIPIRDLSDPRRHGQPDHLDDFRQLPLNDMGDYGGVHINSGIHNKAAFLIISARNQEGRHLFDARSAAQLFYLALTQHLSRTSSFSQSRLAVTLAAQTLFRSSADRNEKLAAIENAFTSVGINPAA
jgi:Zinc metalloprotease (elastase)